MKNWWRKSKKVNKKSKYQIPILAIPTKMCNTCHIQNIQDTSEYWNQPERLLKDTARATVEQVRNNPLAGYEDQDYGNGPQKDDLYQWCLRHKIPKDAKVLEIGCGGGRLCLIWQAMTDKYILNHTIYGMDHAAGAIEVARCRSNKINWRLGCLTNIPFNAEYFDVIFTHTCLQHNSDWKQVSGYVQIHMALKNHGILYLMNEKTFASWEGDRLLNAMYCDSRGSAGTAAWWIYSIAKHGFELVEYYRSNYTFIKI